MQLGIDFGGTDIKIGVVDDDSAIVASDVIPVAGGPDDLARATTRARELLAAKRPDAVGIAVPGVVDRDGRMLHANDKYDWMRDTDVRHRFVTAFDVPVVVENDARAALAGESRVGAAAGETDAVLVTLGTGIGTAALMDGRLVRGARGHAGILGGHVTVDVHAPECPCGNVGCAETLASAWALAHRSPGVADDLRSLFSQRDPAAEDLARAYLRVWGATAVTLCHAYDPDVVVLSGGVLAAGERVRGPIEAYLRRHLWPSAHRPAVRVAPEPQFSVVRGLAALAREARDIQDPVTR